MVTCQPEGSTWAKVELFAGQGGDFTSPLASCRLVQSTCDAESRNIQGAMMSWLSLLLHEKEESEAATFDSTVPGSDDVSGPPQHSTVRTSLHGIAEDLIAAGSAGGSGVQDSSMRLEVCDTLGVLAGNLEPAASKPGRYALMRQGKTILDIEASSDSRSIMLSRHGEIVALATHFGGRRNPELPELTGEEEEHLQVDVRDGADLPDSALLITCALATIVFKPKASANNEDEKSLEASHIPDAATETESDRDDGDFVPKPKLCQEAGAGVAKTPVYYQRQAKGTA